MKIIEMMSIPSLLFALLFALLLGALYHFIRDGGLWHLFVYLLASVAGFAAGHLVGIWRNLVWFPLGALNLGLEIAGGLLFLLVADYLLHLPPRSTENTDGK